MYNPYQPPTAGSAYGGWEPVRPAVVVWFRVYAAVMTLIYLATTIGSFWLASWMADAPDGLRGSEADERAGMGMMLLVVSLACLVAFGVGLFMPARPWAWVYGIVLICIGLTSCLTMPATIPLIIFWIKPETKAYFGRDPTGGGF